MGLFVVERLMADQKSVWLLVVSIVGFTKESQKKKQKIGSRVASSVASRSTED